MAVMAGAVTTRGIKGDSDSCLIPCRRGHKLIFYSTCMSVLRSTHRWRESNIFFRHILRIDLQKYSVLYRRVRSSDKRTFYTTSSQAH